MCNHHCPRLEGKVATIQQGQRKILEDEETFWRGFIELDEIAEFNVLIQEHQAFLESLAPSSSSSSPEAPRAKSPSLRRGHEASAPVREDDDVRSTFSHDSGASCRTAFSVSSRFMPETEPQEFPEDPIAMISEIEAIRKSGNTEALVQFTRWQNWDKGYSLLDPATRQRTAVSYLSEGEIRTLFQFSNDGAPLGQLVFCSGREMTRPHWRFIGQVLGQEMNLSLFLFLAKGTICFNRKYEHIVPAAARQAIEKLGSMLRASRHRPSAAPSSGAPAAYAPRFSAASSSSSAPSPASTDGK